MLPSPAHRRRHRADMVCSLWGRVEAAEKRVGRVDGLLLTARRRLAYTARATCSSAETWPSCRSPRPSSPQSNTMADAMVKPIKRNYARFADPPTPTHAPRSPSSHAGSTTTTAFIPSAPGYRLPAEFISTHRPNRKTTRSGFFGQRHVLSSTSLERRQDAVKKYVDSSLRTYPYIKRRFVDKTTLPRNRSLASGLSEECDHADAEQLPLDAAYAWLVDGRATDMCSRFCGRCSGVRPVRAPRVCAIRRAPIRPQPGTT